MPHIAAKATVSDPFLLARDNKGKPACADVAVRLQRSNWLGDFWHALPARDALATLARNTGRLALAAFVSHLRLRI
ncbi:hypothetical protein ACW9YV_04105 [Paraburkholderia strydomiana]